MGTPLVSVIIPAYNGGDLLAEAVQSVLDQTYDHLELIVVDDASSDGTRTVLARFDDPRLRLIAHRTNCGAHAARRTAFRASGGEIIAFLDQDDLFHPQKLEAHVQYLAKNPDIGFTYNPHYTVLHPWGWVTGIWRPPSRMELADLVLGFPIPPSVWVVRRLWAGREEFWDESTALRGAEVVICGRLFLCGCRFGIVDRVLNYRRIHTGRTVTGLTAKCQDERSCQEIVFRDPRCSAAVRALRGTAFAENCLVWAALGLAQGNLEEGWPLLREAVKLEPELMKGRPSRLTQFLLFRALDEGPCVEAWLRTVLGWLPPELTAPQEEVEWAVQQAHLIAGSRHAVWDRPDDARVHFARAKAVGAVVGEFFSRTLAYELLSYEMEFGVARAMAALERLCAALSRGGDMPFGRRLAGAYHLCRAFHRYAAGERQGVPQAVARAFVADPRSVMNRGAWSILLRSAVYRWLTA